MSNLKKRLAYRRAVREGYQIALEKNRERLAEIQRYFPGWMPKIEY